MTWTAFQNDALYPTADEQLQQLLLEQPPGDWDPISEANVETARYTIHLIQTEVASEARPWREPDAYGEPYGGGCYLQWHNEGGRRANMYFDEGEGTFIIVADKHGIIKEIQQIGMLELRDLWDWFWDPAATWSYSWTPPRH